MGARPADYARAAPLMSYIHVDQFTGPQQLAEFLHKLDRDDAAYNQYFQVRVNLPALRMRFEFIQCELFFVFAVEGDGGVHQYQVLVPNLRCATLLPGLAGNFLIVRTTSRVCIRVF